MLLSICPPYPSQKQSSSPATGLYRLFISRFVDNSHLVSKSLCEWRLCWWCYTANYNFICCESSFGYKSYDRRERCSDYNFRSVRFIIIWPTRTMVRPTIPGSYLGAFFLTLLVQVPNPLALGGNADCPLRRSLARRVNLLGSAPAIPPQARSPIFWRTRRPSQHQHLGTWAERARLGNDGWRRTISGKRKGQGADQEAGRASPCTDERGEAILRSLGQGKGKGV